MNDEEDGERRGLKQEGTRGYAERGSKRGQSKQDSMGITAPLIERKRKTKEGGEKRSGNLLTSFSVALLGGIYDVRDGHSEKLLAFSVLPFLLSLTIRHR